MTIEPYMLGLCLALECWTLKRSITHGEALARIEGKLDAALSAPKSKVITLDKFRASQHRRATAAQPLTHILD